MEPCSSNTFLSKAIIVVSPCPPLQGLDFETQKPEKYFFLLHSASLRQ